MAAIGVGTLAAEGGDLDRVAAGAHQNDAEVGTDEVGRWEKPGDFIGPRIGDDVEILGRTAEQEIAYTAADKERLIALGAQCQRDFAGCR